MLLVVATCFILRTTAEIAPYYYYSTNTLQSPPVYYYRVAGGGPSVTTEKPYNMAEEIDGLVKYYTELAFPNTAQREQRLKLPARSPYRLERQPPPRPSLQEEPQFSLDYTPDTYLPEKSPEYIDKLPFRTAARAAGTPQLLQQQPAAADAAVATTAAPTTTTTNGYNAQGWKTDDDGNVFIGDDNAKLLLIQARNVVVENGFRMPPKKYWDPLPKDWPEADWFGSMYPDSKNYRGPAGQACPKC